MVKLTGSLRTSRRRHPQDAAMVNHPNRSKRPPGAKGAAVKSNPTPAQIRAARETSGLTQTQAAELIYSTLRTWQDWESGERRMHPALMELFSLKALGETPQ